MAFGILDAILDNIGLACRLMVKSAVGRMVQLMGEFLAKVNKVSFDLAFSRAVLEKGFKLLMGSLDSTDVGRRFGRIVNKDHPCILQYFIYCRKV